MKRKWIVWAVIFAVVGVGIYFWTQKRGESQVSYRSVKAERGEIRISILSTGTVQPENRLEIKAPVAGRVDRVLVKEGQKVARGQILAWLSSTERAALLDAARSSGTDELKRWEDLYRATPLVAPISGTIILRSIEPGQTFSNTDAVLVMSDHLTVKAQVDETDIAQVKLKQPATIVLDAYPGSDIPGEVDQIAFEAKTVNNVTTYVVDVLPKTPPEFMRSGMTANVTFNLQTKSGILVVPAEAVSSKDGLQTVKVAGPKGQPVDTRIETGITDGKQIEVISGLDEGTSVLIPQMSSGKKSQTNNPFAPQGPRSNRGTRTK